MRGNVVRKGKAAEWTPDIYIVEYVDGHWWVSRGGEVHRPLCISSTRENHCGIPVAATECGFYILEPKEVVVFKLTGLPPPNPEDNENEAK